jgi:hypothetical protein
MGGLRNVLSRLATRKSRRKSKPGRAKSRGALGLSLQHFETLEERCMLSGDVAASYELSETFALHSYSGAAMTIYLDFNGNTTTGTAWNDEFGVSTITTPAFSTDDEAAFSDAELLEIQTIWQRVAEDFAPFNVDVTTEDPGLEALQNSPIGGDTMWGIRVCIGGSVTDWMVLDEEEAATTVPANSYYGSFNWPSDTPAFVFSESFPTLDNYLTDLTSPAIGYSLGLRFDGTSTSWAYQGHGSGDTSWGPIMGLPLGQSVTQWSQGEYPDANNTEDDLALITGEFENVYGTNGFGFRADDAGNTVATATAMTVSSRTLSTVSGVIEQRADVDVYSFATGPGEVTIAIDPAAVGANLDILATLYDAAGNVLDQSNPTDALNASFTFDVTLEEAGTYYVAVDGTSYAGDSSVGDYGYSDYGSLGQYTITANVQPVYQVLMTPTTGLVTTEAGGTATFTVVLTAAPTSPVTVGLSSSKTTEGTVSASSVVFTPANWDQARTITVTGVDDYLDDGDFAYTIITAACVSNDTNYKGYNFSDVEVTNADDDAAGYTITPLSGLVTSEDKTTATFTVALACQPTVNVTLDLKNGDAGEGYASVSSLTFTASNWNTPQTVTVTGENDDIIDGPQTYLILTDKTTSTDPAFSVLTPSRVADISLTNLDNDIGFVATPASGLVTTEAGGTATFTVIPSLQPTAPITLTLSSSDTTEGTVSATPLVFTTSNWNQAQTVTITGVDDYVEDESVIYHITGTPSGSDARFSDKTTSVDVTNTDNDEAKVVITPTTGLVTYESANCVTFTVQLNSQPTAAVTVGMTWLATDEGTVSPTSLTFASGAWNVPQTVTVTGVNDNIDDGDISYIITTSATSSDADYTGTTGNPDDVTVTNRDGVWDGTNFVDDDVAGVILSRTSGVVTAEYGSTDTFTVRLATQPIADVTISLSSSDTTEGTVTPTSLIFNTTNWSTPRTVTVSGVDDATADGNVVYTVVTSAAVSADPKYSGMVVPDVTATNLDNEAAAGFQFVQTGGLATSENGGTATFTVRLINVQPTSDVTLALSSSNIAEGTLSTDQLVFTAATWNIPQTVTVTGVDDGTIDGNIVYSIVTAAAVSDDANYSGLNPTDLAALNADNDTASVVLSSTSLTTSESGTTATFTLQLSHQPAAPVSVNLYSSDTTEGALSTRVVTFTTSNWNVPQTVTVTGVDDLMADGPITYSAMLTGTGSTDPLWNGVDPSDVSVVNNDNDTAAVNVSPTSLVVNENGSTAIFTLTLNSQPLANVTIGISSSDTGEGTVSASSVIFNSTNWNVPQTVTVTGKADHVVDGNQTFTITTNAAVSSGGDYSGRAVPDVTVVNYDTDSAGVAVTPSTGLATTEAGGTATFTVALTSIPSSTVSFTLSVNDGTEATLDKAVRSITRSGTTATATAPSHGFVVGDLVRISGADQSDYNGLFTVTASTTDTFSFAVAGTADASATGVITAQAVKGVTSIARTDATTAKVTCASAHGLEVGDQVQISGATQAAYNGIFRVTSRPTSTTFTYKVSNTPTTPATGTITAMKTGLTFTTINWNVPQTVTVTGLDDVYQDGDIAYQVAFGPGVTTGTDAYSNMAITPVSLVNRDDDAIEIRRSPTSGLVTSEAGATTTFLAWLGAKPTDTVTVTFSSSDTTEGVVLTTQLSWTPTDWQTPKTVTISGIDDLIDDGNVAYVIQGAVTSGDISYDGQTMSDVAVVNNDDGDTAGITVVAPSAPNNVTHEYGSTVTFTVVLTSQPVDTVTVPITSSDTSVSRTSVSSLTFTSTDWSTPKTVTVTGVDDGISTDLATNYQIAVGPAVSSEAVYSGLNGAVISLVSRNDAPVAVDDPDYVTPVDKPLVVPASGVLTNDSDDGPISQLTASLYSAPSYGTLALNTNGGFTYTPQQYFIGTDQFTYRVTDGQGLTDLAVVTITVGTDTGALGIALAQELWEGQGTVTGAGTVSRPAGASTTTDLVVYLYTPDTNLIALPTSVTIPAGQATTTFNITVIDDAVQNTAWRSAVVWVNAAGCQSSQGSLRIGDNELSSLSFDLINSPQTADVPFAVTVWARNLMGETIKNYAGGYTLVAANSSGAVPMTVESTEPSAGNPGRFISTIAVNATATGVFLTAASGTATGKSNTFDVVAGVLDHLAISLPLDTDGTPADQSVGKSFSVSVTAYDENGYRVTGANGALALSAWVDTGATSSIVISEVADKNGTDSDGQTVFDFIELQNVSTATVSTWHWTLLANNADAGVNSFQSCDLTTLLGLTAGNVVMVSDNSADTDLYDDDYYFGANLDWGVGTGRGWVMLVDQNNALVDFLAWGYTEAQLTELSVTVGSNTIRPSGTAWFGAGAAYDSGERLTLQRTGDCDRNVPADFAWTTVTPTRPLRNADISTTFGTVLQPVTMSGSTLVLVNGTGRATLEFASEVDNVFLMASGLNRTAESLPFNVGPSLSEAAASTPALLDPKTASFYFTFSNVNRYGPTSVSYGYGAANAGWVPLTGDWNADGTDTVGMYDPVNSCFFLTNSTSGGMAQITFCFGAANAGWLPVAGDWNGDGIDTVGLYDPKSSTFYLTNKLQAGFADISFGYGAPAAGWKALAGDWDGDGVDTVGLYVPGSSTFYLRNANSGGVANLSVAFGQGGSGWKPVVGDWDGDGTTTIGVFDPTSSVFYERNTNNSGYADYCVSFGAPGLDWTPLAGNWNGTAALNAVALGTAETTTTLTTADVTGILDAAVAEWRALGLDAGTLATLRSAEIVVTDLPGTQLGQAVGRRIYLDTTAAGMDWFVDTTPGLNEEFSGTDQLQAVDAEALDRIDLLSVVAHELGHLAGVEHLESGLMSSTLPAGVRRLAGLAERDALFTTDLLDDEE